MMNPRLPYFTGSLTTKEKGRQTHRRAVGTGVSTGNVIKPTEDRMAGDGAVGNGFWGLV